MRRALNICSDEEILKTELLHLEKVFLGINQYPHKVVKDVISKELDRMKINDISSHSNKDSNETNQQEMPTTVSMSLPYAGIKGENIVRKLKKDIMKKIDIKPQITYKAKKLASKFQIKDNIKFEHKHNTTYAVKCSTCGNKYVGQTKCRCIKRVIEHNAKDKNSHLLRHVTGTKHTRVWLNDFKILGSGYSSDFKRIISESLYIKELKPELNIQKDSYSLKLLN